MANTPFRIMSYYNDTEAVKEPVMAIVANNNCITFCPEDTASMRMPKNVVFVDLHANGAQSFINEAEKDGALSIYENASAYGVPESVTEWKAFNVEPAFLQKIDAVGYQAYSDDFDKSAARISRLEKLRGRFGDMADQVITGPYGSVENLDDEDLINRWIDDQDMLDADNEY